MKQWSNDAFRSTASIRAASIFTLSLAVLPIEQRRYAGASSQLKRATKVDKLSATAIDICSPKKKKETPLKHMKAVTNTTKTNGRISKGSQLFSPTTTAFKVPGAPPAIFNHHFYSSDADYILQSKNVIGRKLHGEVPSMNKILDDLFHTVFAPFLLQTCYPLSLGNLIEVLTPHVAMHGHVALAKRVVDNRGKAKLKKDWSVFAQKVSSCVKDISIAPEKDVFPFQPAVRVCMSGKGTLNSEQLQQDSDSHQCISLPASRCHHPLPCSSKKVKPLDWFRPNQQECTESTEERLPSAAILDNVDIVLTKEQEYDIEQVIIEWLSTKNNSCFGWQVLGSEEGCITQESDKVVKGKLLHKPKSVERDTDCISHNARSFSGGEKELSFAVKDSILCLRIAGPLLSRKRNASSAKMSLSDVTRYYFLPFSTESFLRRIYPSIHKDVPTSVAEVFIGAGWVGFGLDQALETKKDKTNNEKSPPLPHMSSEQEDRDCMEISDDIICIREDLIAPPELSNGDEKMVCAAFFKCMNTFMKAQAVDPVVLFDIINDIPVVMRTSHVHIFGSSNEMIRALGAGTKRATSKRQFGEIRLQLVMKEYFNWKSSCNSNHPISPSHTNNDISHSNSSSSSKIADVSVVDSKDISTPKSQFLDPASPIYKLFSDIIEKEASRVQTQGVSSFVWLLKLERGILASLDPLGQQYNNQTHKSNKVDVLVPANATDYTYPKQENLTCPSPVKPTDTSIEHPITNKSNTSTIISSPSAESSQAKSDRTLTRPSPTTAELIAVASKICSADFYHQVMADCPSKRTVDGTPLPAWCFTLYAGFFVHGDDLQGVTDKHISRACEAVLPFGRKEIDVKDSLYNACQLIKREMTEEFPYIIHLHGMLLAATFRFLRSHEQLHRALRKSVVASSDAEIKKSRIQEIMMGNVRNSLTELEFAIDAILMKIETAPPVAGRRMSVQDPEDLKREKATRLLQYWYTDWLLTGCK